MFLKLSTIKIKATPQIRLIVSHPFLVSTQIKHSHSLLLLCNLFIIKICIYITEYLVKVEVGVGVGSGVFLKSEVDRQKARRNCGKKSSAKKCALDL